ncbi:hypothetical protein [Haloarchaeobius sp. HRN-SO-5]|uniref:hypothetical protein n=1 Tax=Haloarchaeobius sp. HRN-SO-5 TaxID=3446118 RepID=UPI003EBBB815
MTDTVQCWLVERTFDDRNLVTVVYATEDGRRYRQQERSANSLARSPVLAGREIPVDDLEETPDEETRERYATEATRTAEQYDADEEI